MTPREWLTGSTAALVIVTAPGLAGMLGQAVTGVPDFPTPTPSVPSGDEGLTVWAEPRPDTPSPVRASRSRPLAPVVTGTRLNWAALAECESSGNPKAVSRTGKYRGLVQFSLSSWHAVGMSGDPIDYPATVQLAAAQRLYKLQGPGAWPYCRRFL